MSENKRILELEEATDLTGASFLVAKDGLNEKVASTALKNHLELDLVTNTPDLDKPISTATQTALDAIVAGGVADGSIITAKLADLSVTTGKLADAAVTDAKLRDSTALSVIGRSANSTGVPADIAAGTDGHVLRRSGTTLGFGTIATAGLADAAVTDAKLRNSSALSVLGRSDNSSGVPADIAAANDGEVLRRSGTTLGFGTIATAGIADAAVTNAKMASMAQSTIRGRAASAGTGVPVDLTATEVKTILGISTAAYMGTLLGSTDLDTLLRNGGMGYKFASFPDDTAVSINVGTTGGVGFLALWVTNTAQGGIFAGRVSATVNGVTEIAKTPSPTVGYVTGVLTGTTSTDGRLTFGAGNDGNLYIENRQGGNIPLFVFILKLF